MRNAVLMVLALAAAIVVASLLRDRAGPDRAAGADPAAESAAAREAAGLRGGPRPASPAEAAPSVVSHPSPKPPDSWQPRSIRGRLLFPDGSPAAGARIGLGSIASRPSFLARSRSIEISARTGEDGAFALMSLDEGTYEAYADVERGARRWRLRREVEPGPDEVAWTLEEARLRLTVHVLDPEGSKVASASVHLVMGGRAVYAFASGGVAHFFDLADAPFTGPAALVAELFWDEGPAVWAATAVSGVDLEKGEATVRCERGGVIEGHVAPGSDGRVPAGRVYARAMGGGLRDHFTGRQSTIGPGGSFRFEAMAPGPWRLHAWGHLYATLTEDVVANVGDSGVVLHPVATTSVKVRVVDPAGRPVAGATVFSPMQFEETQSAPTDENGVAVLGGLRPGIPRYLRAVTREDVPRGASRPSWLPEDTTLTLEQEMGVGPATLTGVLTDTTGAPISFVAVWGRQGARVGKGSADEAGRFTLEGLARGPVSLEVRLAEGWAQPESMEPAATVSAAAPGEDVSVVVDLGATLHVRFSNWPYDVDREGAVLVEEASGALVRPISWTWNGVRFGRLDPRATYTLFAHAAATDLFTKTAGLRAGKDVSIRLERGQSVGGLLRSTDRDDETKVVAVLHGVEMEADLGSDGRFEVRGLPGDATVDLVASAAGPGGARREARGRARAGDAAVVLDLTPTPR